MPLSETLLSVGCDLLTFLPNLKSLSSLSPKIRKATQSIEIWVVWGGYGLPKVISNITIQYSAYNFLLDFNRINGKNLSLYNWVKGRLKMQDWKLADQIAGLENAGLEFGGSNSRAVKCRTGKCRTGKCRTKRFLFFAVKLCVLYRDLIIVSTSLYVSIVSEAMLQTCRLAYLCVCLCVCLSVQKVYCGKTAERIRMPFEVVSGVGRGMGVLDSGGDRRKGKGSFEGWIWGVPLWPMGPLRRALLKLI